jgi:hypothetical protein
MDPEAGAWHTRFAKELFNHSWDLLEKPDRTDEESHEMLHAAFASRYHWGVVGTEENWILGDAHISRVASSAGYPTLAIHYAKRALAGTQSNGWQDYRLASAYETVARAFAAAGDTAERDRYIGQARGALDLIDDPLDRQMIEDQIDSVPLS